MSQSILDILMRGGGKSSMDNNFLSSGAHFPGCEEIDGGFLDCIRGEFKGNIRSSRLSGRTQETLLIRIAVLRNRLT